MNLINLDPFAHMFAAGRPGQLESCAYPTDEHRAVIERDGDTCRCCGFRDSGGWRYIQVHHIDHDHSNDGPDNLIAACLHCHGIHHAGAWATQGKAKVVYMPEVPQNRMAVLSRTLLVSKSRRFRGTGKLGKHEKTALFEGTEALERLIDERAAVAARLLGTDDPALLHSALGLATHDAKMCGRLAPFRIVLLDLYDETAKTEGSRRTLPLEWAMDTWFEPDRPYADWPGILTEVFVSGAA